MFLGLLILTTFASAVEPTAQRAPDTVRSCKSERLESPLTPEKLGKLAKHKKIQSPEDLVCCLPESYLESYVTVHTSRALQSGIPSGPRVILFNANHFVLKNFDMALSITGDSPQIHGYKNIEILFNNSQKGELELFDIDFNLKKDRLSKANPSQCLGCHSPDSSEITAGGVKPIFENAPWPFFTGASQFLDQHTKRYLIPFEDQSLQAIAQQKPYSCLNPQTIKESSNSIVQFDSITSEMVSRRNAKLIRASKDYSKFRPLIIGADSDCFPSGGLTDEGLQKFEGEIVKWIPKEQINQIFSNHRFLAENVRQILDLKKAVAEFRQQEVDQEIQIRKDQLEMSKDKMAGALLHPSRRFAELSTDNLEAFRNRPAFSTWSTPSSDIGKYQPITQMLARYTVDTANRSELGGGPSPLLRLIFEGRGISTLTWNRDLAGGYGTSGLSFITDSIFALEKDDLFWKDLHTLLVQSRQKGLDDSGDPKALQQACSILAERSFKGFSKIQ